MDPDYKTLVFDIKLEDILVGGENNEMQHIKIENIKKECFEVEENMWEANEAKIKKEHLDLKDDQLHVKTETENGLTLNSFDHLYVKTENFPTLNFFDHLYMKTENCRSLNLNSFDHQYVKTQDCPYLNSEA